MNMIYETVHSVQLPKMGFGTWEIGGGSYADRSRDAKGLAAIRTAIELGYTHFDTAEMYGAGHTEELLGRAIRESRTARESLFITSKVLPEHLRYDDVLKACEGSLRRLGVDYLDLYLIHWPGRGIKLSETFRALNKLVADGKVGHLGVSNFNLKLLKESEQLAETPILTDQVPYSLSDRSYVKNGVLEYCQGNSILLTAYSPVDQGHFKPGKALREIARARSLSPYQVALAWLVGQPRVIAIPMSQDRQHQEDNLKAVEIALSGEEKKQLE